MPSLTKIRRWECPIYLDFIRAMECLHCGNPPPSDPHHWHPTEKGTGRKPSDCWTVPLCRACHQEYHQDHCLSGLSYEETRQRFLFKQWECMGRWIRNQVTIAMRSEELF